MDGPSGANEKPVAPKRYGFSAAMRVKKSAEIRQILASGQSTSCRGMKLRWLENGLGKTRMAIALRRGYGNAVARNRTKRLVRESYRLLRPRLLAGFDLVFQVFPGPDRHADRSSQVNQLLGTAGILPRAASAPRAGA